MGIEAKSGLGTAIDHRIMANRSTMTGTIASPFYHYSDRTGQWTWACDVDIGDEEVLRSVPVASNNRELIYAEQGKAVTLSKMGDGKWVITGLAKARNSTIHYVFVQFGEDIFAITRRLTRGNIVRPLTYGELGSIVPALQGYGHLPYGAQAKFDAAGNFVEIMEWGQ